jgi:hypothetical protein
VTSQLQDPTQAPTATPEAGGGTNGKKKNDSSKD